MDRLRSGGDESCFRPAPSTARRARNSNACTTTSSTRDTFVNNCRDAPETARRKMLVNLRKDDEPVPGSRTARRKANKGEFIVVAQITIYKLIY